MVMANRRKMRRFIRRCSVEFTVGGVKHTGVSSDFSLGGLFIRTNYPYAPGTVMEITIVLPDGMFSHVMARVTRANKSAVVRGAATQMKQLKNGMGVEILEKDANYLHLIRDLLGN